MTPCAGMSRRFRWTTVCAPKRSGCCAHTRIGSEPCAKAQNTDGVAATPVAGSPLLADVLGHAARDPGTAAQESAGVDRRGRSADRGADSWSRDSHADSAPPASPFSRSRPTRPSRHNLRRRTYETHRRTHSSTPCKRPQTPATPSQATQARVDRLPSRTRRRPPSQRPRRVCRPFRRPPCPRIWCFPPRSRGDCGQQPAQRGGIERGWLRPGPLLPRDRLSGPCGTAHRSRECRKTN